MITPSMIDIHVPHSEFLALRSADWLLYDRAEESSFFRYVHPCYKREVQIAKVRGFKTTSIEDLASWLLDPAVKPLYDVSISFCGTVPGIQLPENMRLVYQFHHGKFGISGRRFVYIEHTHIRKDGVLETVAFSPPKRLRDEANVWVEEKIGHKAFKSFTEGDIVISGFELTKLDGGEIELIYYQCVQPNMRWVPQRLLDRILVEQLKNTAAIPEIFNSKHS
eukprot:GHVH01001120.1.p1 GENE.GHVH01001120.1~~GHVH01001120.1.p1  ORF type:complete len:222 (+),score=19.64 GHVH01001120.1:79-744(+)